MSCQAMQRGESIKLTSPIPNVAISVGATATVFGVNAEEHRIDVFFEHHGLLRDVDAHLFEHQEHTRTHAEHTIHSDDPLRTSTKGNAASDDSNPETFDPSKWVDHIEQIDTVWISTSKRSHPVHRKAGKRHAHPTPETDDPNSPTKKAKGAALNAAIRLASKDKK